jgi:hypothetical protein
MTSKGLCLFFEGMNDPRFLTVKKLIVTGQLGSFAEIAGIVPKTVIARSAGMKPSRLNRILFEDLSEVTVKEVYVIAALIDIPGPTLMAIIERDLARKSRKKK